MRSRSGFLFGLALVVGCGGAAPRERAASTSPGPVRRVATAVVERVSGGETAVPGLVRARQRAALASRIAAAVVDLPRREGERVAKGDLLARLDDVALRAGLAAAETELNVASAELRRSEGLLLKGAATPREREAAESRVGAAKAEREAAESRLGDALLRAPFAGRLAARHVDVGDVVSAGTPLVELEGEAGHELVAALDARVAAALAVGARLRVQVDGQAGSTLARVSALSPAADPMTHRFEARLELAGAPGLRSGVFARLLVPAPGSAPRLLVPTAALVRRGGLSGVFVLDGERARLRWVAAGGTEGDKTEIRAGLAAEERVVLDPVDLADGAAISEAR